MGVGIGRGALAAISAAITACLLAGLPGYLAGEALPASAAAVSAGSLGPLLAWGDNAHGELGDGTRTDEDFPVAVNEPADLRVTTARLGLFGVAVGAAGRVWAWGQGGQGELGNGANKNRLKPVRVSLPPGVKVSSVREGSEFAVAVTSTGRVLAWGLGTSGQLGNGRRKSSDLPVWVRLPRGVRVQSVTAAATAAYALTSDGRVLAWGNNNSGELGDGRPAGTDSPAWVTIPHRTKITAIGAGVDHVLAVTATGGLLAWGRNSAFDLGDGKSGLRRTPVPVLLPSGVKVVAAFAGQSHSLALTAGGRVLAWGGNKAGQLGDGTFTNRRLPVFARVPRHDRIVMLAAGREHSLALTGSGKILAWGDDSAGQLGDGAHGTDRDVPFQIMVQGKVIAIGAGCTALSSVAVVRVIID